MGGCLSVCLCVSVCVYACATQCGILVYVVVSGLCVYVDIQQKEIFNIILRCIKDWQAAPWLPVMNDTHCL